MTCLRVSVTKGRLAVVSVVSLAWPGRQASRHTYDGLLSLWAGLRMADRLIGGGGDILKVGAELSENKRVGGVRAFTKLHLLLVDGTMTSHFSLPPPRVSCLPWGTVPLRAAAVS